VLHSRPCHIGLQSLCSAGRGISDPLAHSSAPPGLRSTGQLDLPQTPTPQTHTISSGHAPKTCEAGDPQAWISHLGHTPQACQAGDPQACRISISLDLHPSGSPGTCYKGLLDGLNDRPQPAGPWDPTHLPPATGGLQTCLGDTDTSKC
jgi:hypothetical protein